MSARRLPFWLFLPALVFGYNIDVNHPIIYGDPANVGSNISNHSRSSYFGYSVLLYSGPNNHSSRVFIGSPRGNYFSSQSEGLSHDETGVAYRCPLLQNCDQIRFELTNGNWEFNIHGYTYQTSMSPRKGWFGATMSLEGPNGKLTVCAPRTVLETNPSSKRRYKLQTMYGMCYTGSVTTGNLDREHSELSILKEETRVRGFERLIFIHPLHGFSINNVPNQPKRIIGEPFYPFGRGSVYVQNEQYFERRQIYNEYYLASTFGYAVTSGCFFKRNEIIFATGAPGWAARGKVVLLNSENSEIESEETFDILGQFFGGSLTAGDMNGDGLDELVVGAPHWKDRGQVYIFIGRTSRNFDKPIILEGQVEGGRFGYSLANGDLDGDGFSDLIVGAPWERSGAIYIYNGKSQLIENSLRTPSQRIEASEISNNILGFGFSISAPADMDFNGYPEIGVGAYKSSHAVVLRGKPVIRVSINVTVNPKSLQIASTSFELYVGLLYNGKNAPDTQNFDIKAKIDEGHRRVSQKELILQLEASRGIYSEATKTVEFVDGYDNFLDPVTISLTHKIINNDSAHQIWIDGKSQNQGEDSFCVNCAVEEVQSSQSAVESLVKFDILCENNATCISNITVEATFVGGWDSNSWVIGSNPVVLKVTVENHGEPAYYSQLNFSIPEGVKASSCDSTDLNKIGVVICNAGNPLNKGNVKTLSLNLDMRQINGKSEYAKELIFNISVITEHENLGEHHISVPLRIIPKASLSVSGKAHEETYIFDKTDIERNFQHVYEVLKFGETVVTEANLTIEVPVALKSRSNSFLRLYEPQLQTPGKYSSCSSDIIYSERSFNETSTEPPSNRMNDPDMNNLEDQENGDNKFSAYTEENTNKRVRRESNYFGNETTTRNLQETGNEQTGSKNLPQNIIYMNCSTKDVVCAKITCSLGSLTKIKDEAKLTLDMILEPTKIAENFGQNRSIIRLSTTAYVEIIRPLIPSTPNEPRRDMANVSTMFYEALKKEEVNLWIIIGSVVLGLILLLAVAGILYHIGFFKRRQKEELLALKANDTPMDGHDEGEEGTDIPLE